jgi:hypothetical protein
MKYDQKDLEDLENRLKIDTDFLDEELVANPDYHYHAGAGAALWESRQDAAEKDYKTEEFVLYKIVREQLTEEDEKGKLKAPTEKQIEAEIKTDKDYHKAFTKFLEAKVMAGKWKALRDAFRGRGLALDGMVRLHSSGYFADKTGISERREAGKRVSNRNFDDGQVRRSRRERIDDD